MTELCKILRAAFLLPFSAGVVTERKNGGYSRHDGSIAGIVLLTTAVIVICEMIGILKIEVTLKMMIVLSSLSVLVLILIAIATRLRSDWCIHRRRESTETVKLGFLWLFCLGNILYQALDLARRIRCEIYEVDSILYYASTWVFHILQSLFIHHFSQFEFANVLCLYYGIVVLSITNISMWTRRIVFNIRHEDNKTQEFSACEAKAEIYIKIEESIEPYLEPVLLEYSLLSLIFLSEMWPRKHEVALSEVNIQHATEDEESDSYSINSDTLLMSSRPDGSRPRSGLSRISWIVLFISIVYNGLFIVLQCIYIYGTDAKNPDYKTFVNAVFFCANLIRTPVIIRCFYAMSGELRPCNNTRYSETQCNTIIIVLSSFATCGFYVIITFGQTSMIYQNSLPLQTFYSINTVNKIIATIYQTIFILQMKQYKISHNRNSCFSIRNMFLFLCISNLGIWASYTFVVPLFIKGYPSDYVIEKFWFPFVIFYHFESFIAFLKLFRE